MEEQIDALKKEIQKAFTTTLDPGKVEKLRITYLGRKGKLNKLFKEMATLPNEERKKYGKMINKLKEKVSKELLERRKSISDEKLPVYDLLLPGRQPRIGYMHPLTRVLNEIVTFFANFGFTIATGPEIEYDWYNFEALNIPKDHPARDMFSSFFIKHDLLLRSHTSPVQIRVMERQKPPIKIICPGRCYRRDAFDASHSPVFHQVEALYVDKEVSFGELKWLLHEFVKFLFGQNTTYQLRPSYFPFTEPSGELVISCAVCGGNGCSVCGNSGWLECGGCGMVHPKVLENCKISTKKYSGYALGMGVERVAMIKYVIDDIRTFFNNDIRFLEQF